MRLSALPSKRDEEGCAIWLSGTFRQITQHKKMEQELQDACDKAEEANRLKSVFLANAINSPKRASSGSAIGWKRTIRCFVFL